MRNDETNLGDMYVRKGGKIYPWGMIQTFCHWVDDTEKVFDGGSCWHPELIPFGNLNYVASTTNTNYLEVRRRLKRGGLSKQPVLQLSQRELFGVTFEFCRVLRNGYLDRLFNITELSYREHPEEQERHARSFDLANQGKGLTRLDNSQYCRVSPNFAGSMMVQLNYWNRYEGYQGGAFITTILGQVVTEFVCHQPFSDAAYQRQGALNGDDWWNDL